MGWRLAIEVGKIGIAPLPRCSEVALEWLLALLGIPVAHLADAAVEGVLLGTHTMDACHPLLRQFLACGIFVAFDTKLWGMVTLSGQWFISL